MAAGGGKGRIDTLVCGKEEYIVAGSENTQTGDDVETDFLESLGRNVVTDGHVLEPEIGCGEETDIGELPVGSVGGGAGEESSVTGRIPLHRELGILVLGSPGISYQILGYETATLALVAGSVVEVLHIFV